MALSLLLQPKLNLRVSRFCSSAARARFYSAVCSNGHSGKSEKPKKEASAEEVRIMAVKKSEEKSLEKKPGLLSMATEILSGFVSSNKMKSLLGLFNEPKDDQSGTTAENDGRKPEAAPSDYQHVCEGGEMSSHPDCSPKDLGLKDVFMKTAGDGSTLEIDKPRNITSTVQPLEHPITPSGEHAEKNSSKGLRLQVDVSSNPTEYCNSTSLVKDNSLNAYSQRSDNNDRLDLLDFLDGKSSIEDNESSNSDEKHIELKELKSCIKVSSPASDEDQRQRRKTYPVRAESVKNKVFVWFLQRHCTESQILEFFRCCGEILKIDFPCTQGPLFKTAYVHFKTREGFEKALKKSGSAVQGRVVFVDSVTSMKKRTLKIPIPCLLGDPDVPAALIKNPTRTIKIESLTHEISSRHIEEALGFCESSISNYSLGSSHSVAYVEFESETGKERALAQQTINVLGRQLQLLRIDCPRTTVVRITHMNIHKLKSITSICKKLGEFSSIYERCPSVLDVHFNLAEWPNMVKILNSLNGSVVEGRRILAEPAPVFPPDVLLALWHHPEERKHLEATTRMLLRKISDSPVADRVYTRRGKKGRNGREAWHGDSHARMADPEVDVQGGK